MGKTLGHTELLDIAVCPKKHQKIVVGLIDGIVRGGKK